MSIGYFSLKNPSFLVSLKDALFLGLAQDGSLFMPSHLPRLEPAFFSKLSSLSFQEICFEVASCLFLEELSSSDLANLTKQALNFEPVFIQLSETIAVLELFHGPTLSFKDFGAQFMAKLMQHFTKQETRSLNVLVATSGDTGSAVAKSFFNCPGFKVWILYPKGQVSSIQEKQMTTLGGNVTALEVEGDFDTCQALVKQAFNDKTLCQRVRLTSANSINIGRLIPQMFFYFFAYSRSKNLKNPLVVSVPSGNFGNVAAGLLAKKMGLPIKQFIAATNQNDTVPRFLKTGIFEPRPSCATLSSAMDVGNPSNFSRILHLYSKDLTQIRCDLFSESFTDLKTKEAICEIEKQYGYIADPHGAVAYLGLKSYLKQTAFEGGGIFLETAHPAKFISIVEPLVKGKVEMPKHLNECLAQEKRSFSLSHRYEDLVELILESRE